MNDYGFIYQGNKSFIRPCPWNYGQVNLSPTHGPFRGEGSRRGVGGWSSCEDHPELLTNGNSKAPGRCEM